MILPGPPVPALPAPPRPTAVTVAAGLQLAMAGLLLFLVVLHIAEAIHYDTLIDEALRLAGPAAAEEARSERSANLVGALVLGIPVLLLAVWFGVTAIGVRRGSNVARILTLIGLSAPLGLGALLCCLGGAGVLMLVMLAPGPGDEFSDDEFSGEEFGTDSAFFTELLRLDEGAWSTAYFALGQTVAVTVFMTGIAVGVLLLTANAYFRPRPPAPWPPYPMYPPPPYWYYGPPR